MGFFLVGRTRDDGSVVLISDRVFDTRQEAVDALSASPVSSTLQSECYVVDLDRATPVLVVQAAAPALPAESLEVVETASVWEAPETPAVETVETEVEELAAEEASEDEAKLPAVETAPEVAEAEEALRVEEPADEEPDATASLADALAGAVGTLEAEGISAPESIGPAPEVIAEEAALEALGAEESVVEPAAWPWETADEQEVAEAGVTAAEEPLAETPASETYVPDDLEEPAADVSELVMTSSEEELPEVARPVILGAYGDETPLGVPREEPPPPPPVAEPASATFEKAFSGAVAGEMAPVEPATAAPAEDPGDLAGVIADLESEIGQSAEAEAPESPTPVLAPAIERTPSTLGDDVMDLSSLTCEECVYLNTCPNKGDLDPSSCGSFQWTSS